MNWSIYQPPYRARMLGTSYVYNFVGFLEPFTVTQSTFLYFESIFYFNWETEKKFKFENH